MEGVERHDGGRGYSGRMLDRNINICVIRRGFVGY